MYIVYQHQLRSTGEVVYYGCGQGKRPWASNGGCRRSEEHKQLMLAGQAVVSLLAEYEDRVAAEKHETRLIKEGRAKGLKLFNKVADLSERGVLGGRGAGKVNGAYIRDNRLGIFSPEMEARRSENSRKSGLLPWWHNPTTGETRRAVNRPDLNFEKGRGKWR